jgi:hypothetical protein
VETGTSAYEVNTILHKLSKFSHDLCFVESREVT